MYQTFSFSLSLTHYELWHLSREWMHKSKSPNSNFRYFFFFLILAVCFLFRENKNSTSASMTQSNGFISARSSSFLSFFFDSPPSVFFFFFQFVPTHMENGFVVVVVCTDRFERGLNWMDSSSQIQFDNNILWNLPVPPYSGRRYRRNQIKWKRKKKGKGER